VRRRRTRPAGEPRPDPTRPAALDDKAARLAAFDLLARKSWSGRELTRRLRRRGAPPEIARSVVADLTARGYVDDQAFARWWAEARARGRRIGSQRLRQELAARGIPREMAEAAIAAAFEEVGEAERALQAGRRRLPGLLRGQPARAPARLADYLVRRGYPPAVVRQTVRALLAERGADLTGIEDDRSYDGGV
jgi:regulatory protein